MRSVLHAKISTKSVTKVISVIISVDAFSSMILKLCNGIPQNDSFSHMVFRRFFQATVSCLAMITFFADDKCTLLSTLQRIINGIECDWLTNNGKPFFDVLSNMSRSFALLKAITKSLTELINHICNTKILKSKADRASRHRNRVFRQNSVTYCNQM